MELGKLNIWINENRIEDIQKYAEVKCMIYTLFENQMKNMTERKKSMYIDMLKKQILRTQESLELMHELCSNVFDVEV